MNDHRFHFCETLCRALPSGALWLPETKTLCVSDLHLGKSDRVARRSGQLLPPYEVQETLTKLSDDINRCAAAQVICLGDSFDDLAAARALDLDMTAWISRMQAGRHWVWIEGNHDPGPVALGGDHLAEYRLGHLTFRHIATDATGEISGHYHPKHRLAGRRRPAFLMDVARMIMPAYGTYTGGLDSRATVLQSILTGPVTAILTGRKALAVPVL